MSETNSENEAFKVVISYEDGNEHLLTGCLKVSPQGEWLSIAQLRDNSEDEEKYSISNILINRDSVHGVVVYTPATVYKRKVKNHVE